MTTTQRKAALARTEKLAQQARNLVHEGSELDWRPFVAELADEVALIWKLLLQPTKTKTRTVIRTRRGEP